MRKPELVLVLDVGTTNLKVFLYDAHLAIIAQASQPNPKTRPQPGWVEQDPGYVFTTACQLLEQVAEEHLDKIGAIGLTNQRESVVIWDKLSGQPLYPIVVWEDQRAAGDCSQLAKRAEVMAQIRQRTGLKLNAYFSAPKLRWLLNGVADAASLKSLAFGTLDSWLLFQLTAQHLTDYTNAARTLLFNIHTKLWDRSLLDLFGIPPGILPQIKPSFSHFGTTRLLGKPLPILGVAGDQQASLYAAGHTPGTLKVTYGTGIFPMKIINGFELRDKVSTTLAIGSHAHPVMAFETKVENAAARTTPLLDQPESLANMVRELAGESYTALKPLLDGTESELTIDGGISQNAALAPEIARLSGLNVRHQLHPDGAPLGIAKLIFDNH
ncbi:glycerol kinase [Candidatus Microgenomates bacterium]|nr:glycerol kinase [Candidatus Microgenomates bacterium]